MKNEETQDKLRARTMVTTDLGEGMAELRQQIAKLMATLTQTGERDSPYSAPGSPQECGCGLGHCGRSTPSCPNSCNGRDGPGQMIQACSLLTEHWVEVTESWGSDQGNCGPSIKAEGIASCQNPLSLQCFRCQWWGHMARECPTPAAALNQPRGTEGMHPTSYW